MIKEGQIFLGFDTETTGIPLRNTDINDPRQPRIVQLAAAVYDHQGNTLRTLNAIIKPDGFDSIPEGAQKAHGISIERCHEEGRPMKEVLEEFNDMKAQATDRFAYNIPFDKKMLLREGNYHGVAHDSSKFDNSSWCVMEMMTSIAKMAPTERMVSSGYGWKSKPPKLIEAYQFCFGKPFDGAHDAMNDVNATKEIFFWIAENKPDYFTPKIKKEWVNPNAPKKADDTAALTTANFAF